MNKIILENGELRTVIYPTLGGKITSLFVKRKDFELVPSIKAGRTESPRNEDDFSHYAYGLDDAFPNIDTEDVEVEGEILHYPSHGEIWSHEMKILSKDEHSLALFYESECFGYSYKKTITLEDNKLLLDYSVCNGNKFDLPAIWTWHGLVRYEPNMKILLPENKDGFLDVLANKHCEDIMEFLDFPEQWMAKYYIYGKVSEGKCGIYYPSNDVTYQLTYDKEKLPYLGIWINAGALEGDYNCALEPSNGFYDAISIAQKEGKLPVIRRQERIQLRLCVMLE